MRTNISVRQASAPPPRGVRPAVLAVLGIISLACVGLVVIHLARSRALPTADDPSSPGLKAQRQSAAARAPSMAHHVAAGPFSSRIEVTPELRDLIYRLADPMLARRGLTEDEAAAWKSDLQRLIDEGDFAVAAIHEFLAKNMDVTFGPNGNALLGYSSARMALIDALAQVGSPLAEMALADVLKHTADPMEIAQVGRDLEKLEPGVYRADVIDAVRQTLAMAAGGNLPGIDVGPLFQTLRQFGGADTVGDLEAATTQWSYYAAMALAQLPGDAGLASLVRNVSGADGPAARTAALQALVELASQSVDARNALIEQVRQGKLSSYDWATLVQFLAGNQMVFQNSAFDNALVAVNSNDLRKTMIAMGNQSFYIAPLSALTPAQIDRQRALIDQLLGVTTDPAAVQVLHQAKASLDRRSTLLAGSSVP